MPTLRDILVLVSCFIIHLYIRRRNERRTRLPLPPGPKRLPWIGNALSMPQSYAFEYYHETAKELGTNVLYLEAFGSPMVVLTELKAVQDLMEKRSAIYSSRPHLAMLHDLIDLNSMLALMPYGDVWREQRKIFQRYFSPRTLEVNEQWSKEFIHKSLLPNLLRTPQKWQQHVQESIGGISMAMTYGIPIKISNDPWVQMAEEAFTVASGGAVAGKWLVDILPWLKYVPAWFPGAGFKTKAKEWNRFVKDSVSLPFQASKEAMENGTAKPCFVTGALQEYSENMKDYAHKEQMIQEIASNIYAAAAETISAALSTFVLAMLTFPEVQRKAQQEIDSIVGQDRLPEVSDYAHLPYTSAVFKEVLRWHAIPPAGIPHCLTEDDEYNGYRIPKGSVIIANIYSLYRNEEHYPDPEDFRPERFLRDGKLKFDVPDPEAVGTFGFGRRTCPGSKIALMNYHLAAMSILSLFDISNELDKNGKPIDVLPRYTGINVVSAPSPFPCKFSPRSMKNVEGMLGEFMGVEVI